MWYRFRHPKMKFKNKSIVWETCTHSNPFAVTENSCNLAIDQAGTARKFHSSCWIGPAWSENSFILAGPGRNDQKIPFFFLDQAGTVGKFLYTVLVVTAGTDKICPGPTWLENSVILAGPCRLYCTLYTLASSDFKFHPSAVKKATQLQMPRILLPFGTFFFCLWSRYNVHGAMFVQKPSLEQIQPYIYAWPLFTHIAGPKTRHLPSHLLQPCDRLGFWA